MKKVMRVTGMLLLCFSPTAVLALLEFREHRSHLSTPSNDSIAPVKVETALGGWNWGCPWGYILQPKQKGGSIFEDSDGVRWVFERDEWLCKFDGPNQQEQRYKFLEKKLQEETGSISGNTTRQKIEGGK